MKKITGFFLAFLPIFVILLLFASGMLIKGVTHVYVSAVEITESKPMIQKTVEDEQKAINPTHQLKVNVLPFNATDPTVYWTSSDESVCTVDDKGLVSAVDFGQAYVSAISRENETIFATCKVEVYDDQIHDISINNEFGAKYLGIDQSINLNAQPKPNTHLAPEVDPTLTYQVVEGNDHVDISPNGDVTAKSEGKAKIKVHCESSQIQQDREVEVTVGKGVADIDFKNPNNVVIDNSKFDLHADMIAFPETHPENYPADDFTYEIIQNDDVATVDDKGVLSFKQAGSVTTKITYKRNPNLSKTKTVISTCNNFADVAFNTYTLSKPLSEYIGEGKDPYISPDDINWHIYPQPKEENYASYEITSSDPTVVWYDDIKNQLKVKKAGVATITATINKGTEYEKSDVCLVTITDAKQDFAHNAETNDYYYYLGNCIDSSKLTNPYAKPTYELVSGSDNASIDDEGFIHFNKSIEAKVKATIEGVSAQFTVKCNGASTEAETIDITKEGPVRIEVGKKYKFHSSDGYAYYPVTSSTNFTPIYGDFGAVIAYVPKHGLHSTDFVFYNSISGILDSITKEVIVSEPGITIGYDEQNQYYITPDTTVPFSKVATVIPSTATDSSGNRITFDYLHFTPADPKSVKIDNDSILFTEPTYVTAQAIFQDHVQTFYIRSTCGQIGKFKLEYGGQSIFSGNTTPINISSQSPAVLTLTSQDIYSSAQLSKEYFDNISVWSATGSDVITCQKNFDLETGTGSFTFTPKDKEYGSDTIVISSVGFNFYLNLEISNQVNDLRLFYKGIELSTSEATNSYIDNLTLNCVPTPIPTSSEQIDITCTVNDQQVDVVNYSIDLSSHLQPGENTIVLSSNGVVKTYTINKKDITQLQDFTIIESEQAAGLNKVYIPSGATAQAMNIQLDGIVDDQFWNNFSVELIGTEQGTISEKPTNGRIYLSDIPRPTSDKPGYENQFKVTLNNGSETIDKTFSLEREIVSKIILPHHDNNLQECQPGFQKVKVIGKDSVYSPAEGLVNYYKLPIELYDYNGQLIEDTKENPDAKQKAFESLNVTATNDAGFKYHNVMLDAEDKRFDALSYIEFTPAKFYSVTDLANNNFTQTDDIKPTITIATHSDRITNAVHAKYTFVPTDGRNVYCQEALVEQNKQLYSQDVVLQTNFGLEGTTKDNVPFTVTNANNFRSIIGNGYTINFNAYTTSSSEDRPVIYTDYLINTIFQGANTMKTDGGAEIKAKKLDIDKQTGYWYYYSTIKNNYVGLDFYVLDAVNAYVKNSLFCNNAITSVNINGGDEIKSNVYLEDNVFFNCSSCAISTFKTGKAYMKGFCDVYNFKGKELLDAIVGSAAAGLIWPLLKSAIVDSHVDHTNAIGGVCTNANVLSQNDNDIYFWNEQTGDYQVSDRGNPSAAPHLIRFFLLDVKEILGFSPSLWATLNPQHSTGAPSYYDQFDSKGNIRWDFMNQQVRKIVRYNTNIWWVL